MRAHPEVSKERRGSGLDVDPELLVNGERNDVVGNGDVLRADSVHRVPLPVRKGAVIEDDIGRIAHIKGTLTRVRVQAALAKTHVDDDNVRVAACRDLAGHDADAQGGRGGAVHRDGPREAHGAFELNVAAHIEDHDAVALAHSVAEAARVRVVEVGHVVRGVAGGAGGDGAEADCAWERERRGGQDEGEEGGEEGRNVHFGVEWCQQFGDLPTRDTPDVMRTGCVCPGGG